MLKGKQKCSLMLCEFWFTVQFTFLILFSLSATKPSEKAKESKKIKHDFRTTSDGRLIITEDDEEEDTAGKKGMDDEDDLDDLLDAMGGGQKVSINRKYCHSPQDHFNQGLRNLAVYNKIQMCEEIEP